MSPRAHGDQHSMAFDGGGPVYMLPAALLDRLFPEGVREALAAHYSAQRPRAPMLGAGRLKRVLDLVEARLADDLSLGDLAAEACLSPFHFVRLFRDATGLPPRRYLTSRRIEAARTMLAGREASLVQIAFDTGFGSQGSFTRAFRKWTGLTPGQYRELCGR